MGKKRQHAGSYNIDPYGDGVRERAESAYHRHESFRPRNRPHERFSREESPPDTYEGGRWTSSSSYHSHQQQWYGVGEDHRGSGTEAAKQWASLGHHPIDSSSYSYIRPAPPSLTPAANDQSRWKTSDYSQQRYERPQPYECDDISIREGNSSSIGYHTESKHWPSYTQKGLHPRERDPNNTSSHADQGHANFRIPKRTTKSVEDLSTLAINRAASPWHLPTGFESFARDFNSSARSWRGQGSACNRREDRDRYCDTWPAGPSIGSTSRSVVEGRSSKRLLLVLDLNGTLLHRMASVDWRDLKKKLNASGSAVTERYYRINTRVIFLRPHLRKFLLYILRHHDVAVWTSAMVHNAAPIVQLVFGDLLSEEDVKRLTPEHVHSSLAQALDALKEGVEKPEDKSIQSAQELEELNAGLQFLWTDVQCDIRGKTTKKSKRDVIKDLEKIWTGRMGVNHSLLYGSHNTLLIDDSPEKFRYHRLNGIALPTYEYGGSKSPEDKELIRLVAYLKKWEQDPTDRIEDFVRKYPFSEQQLPTDDELLKMDFVVTSKDEASGAEEAVAAPVETDKAPPEVVQSTGQEK